MKKKLIVGVVLIAAVAVAGFIAPRSGSKQNIATTTPELGTSTEQAWACNADAKLCPDGSSLGRTGPRCEFPACPGSDATFARIETYLGGRDGGLNLILRPFEVVSDSRCAPGIQCIWAGTVEVRTALETKVAHGELIFKLGEPQTVGDLTVTLVEVRPGSKEEAKDPEHGYWFVFEAKRNI